MSWGERAQITELRSALLKMVAELDAITLAGVNLPTISRLLDIRKIALDALNQGRYQ